MVNLIYLFLLAFLASIIALLGGVIFLFNQKLSRLLEKNSVPFAAGVLITVSLLGLLPEALDFLGQKSLQLVFFSFFGAYFFEHFVFSIHHHTSEHKTYHHQPDYQSFVPLVILGDSLHNFIDGVAIAASFFLSPGLGLITAVSTILHEIPHEIGDFGLLLKAGWKKKDILLINILSASTTILGTFTALAFYNNQSIMGTFLSISAGLFLYLGTIDFLPHATEGFSNRIKAIIPLILGITVMIITLMAIPHSS